MSEPHPFDRVLVATVHAVKALMEIAVEDGDDERKARLSKLSENLQAAIDAGGARTWGM